MKSEAMLSRSKHQSPIELFRTKYKGNPGNCRASFSILCFFLYLHAGQPVNADCAACGVAPELDELLDGEDTSEVLDGSAVLSMASLELIVSCWVAGEPSDVGHADDIAVQVSLEHACAAGWAAVSGAICSGLPGAESFITRPYPLVLTSVVFCRCSAWVYISVSTAPIL